MAKKGEKVKQSMDSDLNVDDVKDPSQLIEQMRGYSESLYIVSDVLSETILKNGGDHLYNKYLQPKIRPYVAK